MSWADVYMKRKKRRYNERTLRGKTSKIRVVLRLYLCGKERKEEATRRTYKGKQESMLMYEGKMKTIRHYLRGKTRK